MSTEIVLPKIGFSMTEGVLEEWMVEDGGMVEKGCPLFAFQTDKAIEEVEAPITGKLKIIAEIGETYEVGQILGYIE